MAKVKEIITSNPRWLFINKKLQAQGLSWKDYVMNPTGIVFGQIAAVDRAVTSGEVLTGTPLEGLSLTTGLITTSKLWRLRLLMDQHPEMEKVDKKLLLNDSLNYHTTKTLSTLETISPESEKIQARRDIHSTKTLEEIYSRKVNSNKEEIQRRIDALEKLQKEPKNQILIYKYDDPTTAVILQNRPVEVKVDPKTSWNPVQVPGRNNPIFIYTGCDDTITIDISWYANDKENPFDILNKCRMLESWSKADGYVSSPPILGINWGGDESNENQLFSDYQFILESAGYTLGNFRDKYRGENYQSDGQIKDGKLLPMIITQTLVFHRISQENLTAADIANQRDLNGRITTNREES